MVLTEALSSFAAACTEKYSFFDFPTWYKWLDQAGRMEIDASGRCVPVASMSVADLSLILLSLLDIALRLAGIVAVGFVVYGGIQLVTSQGDPEGIKRGRQTIINALIGLVISLFATVLVAFVGTSLI
ncbi:MAG TPA: hypothetical protein VFB59_01085 [Candidatus Saccharimonadales bacterium]|nr:hypothetical protein [Candidatus Saccharimonadales bacterium]